MGLGAILGLQTFPTLTKNLDFFPAPAVCFLDTSWSRPRFTFFGWLYTRGVLVLGER